MKLTLFFFTAFVVFVLPGNAHASISAVVGDSLLTGVLLTILYSVLGLVLMVGAYRFIDIVTPGNLGEELTKNKNVAMAILVGSMMLGVSIIIAAAMVG